MENPIEEIKNRLDIVDVIGSYIKLKKAGANYTALCPFHSEKKPSFFVSPSRQIWKCFGCGLGGDVFAFIKEIEGVEFGDALKILAKRAGVELRPIRPELRTERQRLYEICELACKFFEKQLQESKTGKAVKNYLLKRAINEDSQVLWRLGYAPDKWHDLSNFLVSRGYKREEIIKAGLAIKDEKGNFYDRFRKRIIFPIFDLNSQVIGFGGRVFKSQIPNLKSQKLEEVAKYINIPNTLLYDKSRILYGLDKAKVAIRKENSCILVEGYVDVILSFQSGIKNIVSVSGTALTPYQLNILKRYSDNLLLAFDMDVAGDSATKRGIDLAQEKGFDIKIVLLPAGKDPADVISENPKDWKEFLAKAKSILDFYFDNTFSQFDKKSPEGKKEIAKILLPVLKRIPNQIVRFYWVQKLAGELGVREKDVLAELEKIKIQAKEPELSASKRRKKTRRELLEEKIVSLAIREPENIKLLKKGDFKLFSPVIKEILSSLQKLGLDFDQLQKTLPTASFERLNFLALEAEIKEKQGDFKKEFADCLREMKRLETKKELREISQKIKEFEEKGEVKKAEQLTKKFNALLKKLEE